MESAASAWSISSTAGAVGRLTCDPKSESALHLLRIRAHQAQRAAGRQQKHGKCPPVASAARFERTNSTLNRTPFSLYPDSGWRRGACVEFRREVVCAALCQWPRRSRAAVHPDRPRIRLVARQHVRFRQEAGDFKQSMAVMETVECPPKPVQQVASHQESRCRWSG